MPVIQPEKLDITYQAGDTDDVVLSVIIGEGQFGGSVVEKEEEIIGEGLFKIEDIALGTGAHLRSRPVVVKSFVVDVRQQHDRTSVKYTLSGGPFTQEFKRHQEVPPNNAIHYQTTITFPPPPNA